MSMMQYITEKTMKKILALILAIVIVLPLVACKKEEEDPAPAPAPEVKLPLLLDLDLSAYVEVDEKYYKNLTVEVKTNKVTELDVENAIIQVLCASKNKTKLENGDGIVTVGDIVNIFYKGYYLETNEQGGQTKVYFDGGSNVGSNSYALEIGSGGFIPGFEYNMIGMDITAYSSENPLTVEAYFPEDYHAANLQGKTAYFEVFVACNEDGSYKIEEYSAPELNETFIKETLKFTDEVLAEYDGDTVVEKYRSYVVEILTWDGVSTEGAIWSAFWESVLAGAVIKQYPAGYVDARYNEIMATFNTSYESYSKYYSYDEFARLYFGVSSGADWKPEARKFAEDEIKQELIFYYIMDVEGLDPTVEEYEQLFDKYLDKALADNNITIGNFNTEEEYLEHKKQYKAKILQTNGEEYFREVIFFSVGYDAIIGYANVVEITE